MAIFDLFIIEWPISFPRKDRVVEIYIQVKIEFQFLAYNIQLQ